MDEFSFPTIARVEDSLFQLPFPQFNSSSFSAKATDWRFPTLNDADREERMDMLWEIFNEELVWISYDNMAVEKLEEEAMPVSATMDVEMVKMLKKFLLIQKYRSAEKEYHENLLP